MLDRKGNSNSSLLTIADYHMIEIKTHRQLLYEHVLQPFTVVLHGGISANTSKVKVAFIMYLTYLKTEQIFFWGGEGGGDCVTMVSGTHIFRTIFVWDFPTLRQQVFVT